MIEIGYEILPIDRELSPLWRKGPPPDLSTVSAMDLAYQYFLSHVDFVVAGENIGRRWGSTPLLDFAASIKFLAIRLAKAAGYCHVNIDRMPVETDRISIPEADLRWVRSRWCRLVPLEG